MTAGTLNEEEEDEEYEEVTTSSSNRGAKRKRADGKFDVNEIVLVKWPRYPLYPCKIIKVLEKKHGTGYRKIYSLRPFNADGSLGDEYQLTQKDITKFEHDAVSQSISAFKNANVRNATRDALVAVYERYPDLAPPQPP